MKEAPLGGASLFVSMFSGDYQAPPQQPPPQHPPPLPPPTGAISPSEPTIKEANTDSCRSDALPQSGQLVDSSIWFTGRSRSKWLSQIAQAYS